MAIAYCLPPAGLFDSEYLEPRRSGNGLHRHPCARSETHERLADRGFIGDAAGARRNLGRLDDRVGLLTIFVPAHGDAASQIDHAWHPVGVIDRLRPCQHRLDLGDAAIDQDKLAVKLSSIVWRGSDRFGEGRTPLLKCQEIASQLLYTVVG